MGRRTHTDARVRVFMTTISFSVSIRRRFARAIHCGRAHQPHISALSCCRASTRARCDTVTYVGASNKWKCLIVCAGLHRAKAHVNDDSSGWQCACAELAKRLSIILRLRNRDATSRYIYHRWIDVKHRRSGSSRANSTCSMREQRWAKKERFSNGTTSHLPLAF